MQTSLSIAILLNHFWNDFFHVFLLVFAECVNLIHWNVNDLAIILSELLPKVIWFKGLTRLLLFDHLALLLQQMR